MTTKEETKAVLLQWLDVERRQYAEAVKYGSGMPGREALIQEMQVMGLGPQWMTFITNYLRRAEIFNLTTPQGRQALGKTITTLMHCLETAIEAHGPMPKPGVPSGVMEDWGQ